MKITLATHDSLFGRYVAATLAGTGAVDRVLIETTTASWRFYWRKLRRVGVVDFAFQAWLGRWMKRAAVGHLPDRVLPPHERVRSLNDVAFGPDEIVLAFGTSYIRASTLARTPHGILNLHTGILPAYRGVKSEFWALYEGADGTAGWTLHYMTAQLDAGDIVCQRQVCGRFADPARLRAAILRDAMPVVAALLHDVRQRGPDQLPRTPQGPGRYLTTPTWREWRAWQRRRPP